VLAVERSTWIDHMIDEFYDVEVETARDFLLGNWTVNSRLASRGYGAMTPSVINMLNRLCIDVIHENGVRVGHAEAVHAMRAASSPSSGEIASSSDGGDVAVRVPQGVVGGWEASQHRRANMRGPFAVLDEVAVPVGRGGGGEAEDESHSDVVSGGAEG
jgi:hypothetical protein